MWCYTKDEGVMVVLGVRLVFGLWGSCMELGWAVDCPWANIVNVANSS